MSMTIGEFGELPWETQLGHILQANLNKEAVKQLLKGKPSLRRTKPCPRCDLTHNGGCDDGKAANTKKFRYYREATKRLLQNSSGEILKEITQAIHNMVDLKWTRKARSKKPRPPPVETDSKGLMDELEDIYSSIPSPIIAPVPPPPPSAGEMCDLKMSEMEFEEFLEAWDSNESEHCAEDVLIDLIYI